MSLIWPAKDPAETLDYVIDWTARLNGDTIASSTVTLAVPAGMTKQSDTHSSTSVTVWLSGGTAGLTGSLVNTVTTAGGRTLTQNITLSVLADLIVEDGTGITNADTYASVATADTYHGNRGNSAWFTLTGSAKEAALRQATDYMLQVYRLRWSGNRATVTQALDWPRFNVPMRDGPSAAGGIWVAYYPLNSVPVAVSNACAELALRANSGPLIPDLTQAVKSRKIGQIEVVYQDYSMATKTYRAIDDLLRPLLVVGGGVRVVRG